MGGLHDDAERAATAATESPEEVLVLAGVGDEVLVPEFSLYGIFFLSRPYKSFCPV